MKHNILIAAVLLLATVAYAQKPAEAAETAKQEGPVMSMETNVVDYGDVAHGSEPLRKVVFTNTGTEPLIITNAKGSCGCTVPSWPREPILPGETAELEVRYDTKRTGPINRTIKLTTNESHGGVTLRITGTVLADNPDETLPKKEAIFGSSKGDN